MLKLEECIQKFVDLFEEYASEDNDCLSRDEFKALVIDEISCPDYKVSEKSAKLFSPQNAVMCRFLFFLSSGPFCVFTGKTREMRYRRGL